MRHASAAITAVLSCAVLLGTPVHAATFTTTSFHELAELADVVVRVRVTSAEARWLDESGPSRLVTFHEARVLEVVKGRVTDDEARAGTLLVGVPGGVLGDVGQRVPGAPALEVGREYLLLLGRAEGPGGARGIAGLSHGVLPSGPQLPAPDQQRLDDVLPLLRGARR